ncbi:MAG: hypothetical protein ACR2LK_10615 [Solirubrobacteraceae bacterium]
MSETSQDSSRRPRLSLLLVVGSLLVAGCGGDDSKQSTAEFTKAATAATSETSKIGQDVGEAVTTARTQTDAALESSFGELTERVRDVVDDLEALDPPDEASAKVDALAEALEGAAEHLDRIAMAAGSSDPEPGRVEAARDAAEKLVGDSPEIMKANATLKEQLSANE